MSDHTMPKYVVLTARDSETMQDRINKHARNGYRVVAAGSDNSGNWFWMGTEILVIMERQETDDE